MCLLIFQLTSWWRWKKRESKWGNKEQRCDWGKMEAARGTGKTWEWYEHAKSNGSKFFTEFDVSTYIRPRQFNVQCEGSCAHAMAPHRLPCVTTKHLTSEAFPHRTSTNDQIEAFTMNSYANKHSHRNAKFSQIVTFEWSKLSAECRYASSVATGTLRNVLCSIDWTCEQQWNYWVVLIIQYIIIYFQHRKK